MDKSIHVNVGDTHLFVIERGEGYPLILLHGGPGTRCSEFFAAASISGPLPTPVGATHPIEVFFFRHHALMAALNLVATNLLALVGGWGTDVV